jgi:ribosomal protein S14
MTAHEENILMNQAYLKKGTVITELIKSCLVDNVDPLDLLQGDRNALMVAIRVTGYGHLYDAELACSECGAKTAREFNLARFPIRPLQLQPVNDGLNEFQFILPTLKLPVHFRFLTGRDEVELLKANENAKKVGLQGVNAVTDTLLRQIVSIRGVTDRAKLSHLIQHMPARDSSELRKFIRDSEPGIELKQETSCTACGHTEEVSMPLGVSFLWPNAG